MKRASPDSPGARGDGDLGVRLFGKLRVLGRSGPINLGDPRKAAELFCYLVVLRDRPHHREALADLLWSDSGPTQSRKYLRQALWQLQSVLVLPGTGVHHPVLSVDRDWIQMNPAAGVWVDVHEFERAYAQVKGTVGEDLSAGQAETLRSGVDLYQGELLEGWYQDWAVWERERLKSMYLTMLDKLLVYSELHRELEWGLRYGALILKQDRAHERTHWRLMRLQYMAGDRTGALRQYRACAAALSEELGVEPARRMMALYRELSADRVPALPMEPDEVSARDLPGHRSAESLDELLQAVTRLQGLLERLLEALRVDPGTAPPATGAPVMDPASR